MLSGEGKPRIGDDEPRVGPGDCVALPTDEDCAHQLSNDGDNPLRYPCLSTMEEPDVLRHPDSEKVGVFAGAASGGDSNERTYNGCHRIEDAVGY